MTYLVCNTAYASCGLDDTQTEVLHEGTAQIMNYDVTPRAGHSPVGMSYRYTTNSAQTVVCEPEPTHSGHCMLLLHYLLWFSVCKDMQSCAFLARQMCFAAKQTAISYVLCLCHAVHGGST